MDDILLVGNDLKLIVTTQNWLSSIFKINDMSQADYVFGIKIQRDRFKRLLSFSQETYIERILECFCMYNSQTIDTLIKKGHIFNTKHYSKIEEKNKKMTNVPYSFVIGSLM